MASSAGYNKMFPVSWTELHRDARALAWRLADLGPFKGLVAITRGGLVPAAIVARELNLRLIDTVCCSTYDRMERGAKVELLKGTDSHPARQFHLCIMRELGKRSEATGASGLRSCPCGGNSVALVAAQPDDETGRLRGAWHRVSRKQRSDQVPTRACHIIRSPKLKGKH